MNATVTEKPRKPLLQTLDMLSPSQIAAIRKIPAHDASSALAIEARRPAAIFTTQARYDLEQTQVFRKRAVPVTLSVMLPEPGAAMAHDGYGTPLLVTRDRDGQAHVFLNVCQHKGSKLLKDCQPVKDSRLVCPYHAWTFGLDGKLIGVPRQETFVNLDKKARNLKALPTREFGGFIWAILDKDAEPDFSSLVPELAADMEALELPTAHIYGHKTFHLTANWKLVQEPFLEGYHVTRLHAQSIGALYADVPNVVDHLGPHIRQISGKANFTPADLDLPDENVHKTVTHAYLIFPNTVVVTSPYYLSVMFIMPNAVNKTTVDYFMLTRAPADNPKAEALYARSYDIILNVFGNEDYPAAENAHAGLEAGGLEDVVYSGLEATILDYYEELERCLLGE